MAKHQFSAQIRWPGGRNTVGQLETGHVHSEISIPQSMDGPGIGTNPDEMLLGAAATCYTITLGALLERNNIAVLDFAVNSEAIVDVTNGVFTYEKIIHHLHLKLLPEMTRQKIELAEKLAKKAESSCMISRSLNGNVQVVADIHIER